MLIVQVKIGVERFLEIRLKKQVLKLAGELNLGLCYQYL